MSNNKNLRPSFQTSLGITMVSITYHSLPSGTFFHR